MGQLDYGDGRQKTDDHAMIFSSRNCNCPQPAYAKWWLTQLRRWGMLETTPDYDTVAANVMHTQLYSEAMSELGVTDRTVDNKSWSLFDGKQFDPTGDCEAYAKSFAIHNMKASW